MDLLLAPASKVLNNWFEVGFEYIVVLQLAISTGNI